MQSLSSSIRCILNADDKTYVEPDISVICDSSTLDSPGTKRIDYGIKLFKYRSAGVREYWIVNPLTKIVNVFDLEKEELSDQYRFDDDIQVCIYDNLVINITELLK
jgi:Uma2 family endonuclease